ncbi:MULTISPECIES: hypothetical protein [unclassified Chelatococcus]|uniref:hypothetical protein n=1 Tax=unclassified Chelatococcus TaxID=2638111 RepID=UPI001BD1A18F|nr:MULTISPECIES: hypothetical protein [unclassified Chelatococcus]MBS7698742.1 hypothetical protein [Chelatococcus sp. YT9]MBX3554676.1 hypothetical protein [Chelatococcus sp.]
MTAADLFAFEAGDRVEKYKGEALWHGTVVSAYLTTRGKPRYVVDVEPQGFQMIAVEGQLRASAAAPQPKPPADLSEKTAFADFVSKNGDFFADLIQKDYRNSNIRAAARGWYAGIDFAKGKADEKVATTSDTAEMPPSHTAMQRALDAMRGAAPQPAMPNARALSIVAAICERSFHAMGMAALVEELQGVSLAEMIEATRLVKAENGKAPIDGKQTVRVVPDDRLIAAAYALANYEPSHGAVVSEPDGDGLVKALAIVRLTAAPPREGDYA